MLAISRGNANMVELFLDASCDINATDDVSFNYINFIKSVSLNECLSLLNVSVFWTPYELLGGLIPSQ